MDGGIPPAGSAEPDSGALSRGWQRSSGTRSADGGVVGTARGASLDAGSRFDIAIPKNGYAWWYVDALSDDGLHALTVIALIGSMNKANDGTMVQPSVYLEVVVIKR